MCPVLFHIRVTHFVKFISYLFSLSLSLSCSLSFFSLPPRGDVRILSLNEPCFIHKATTSPFHSSFLLLSFFLSPPSLSYVKVGSVPPGACILSKREREIGMSVWERDLYVCVRGEVHLESWCSIKKNQSSYKQNKNMWACPCPCVCVCVHRHHCSTSQFCQTSALYLTPQRSWYNWHFIPRPSRVLTSTASWSDLLPSSISLSLRNYSSHPHSLFRTGLGRTLLLTFRREKHVAYLLSHRGRTCHCSFRCYVYGKWDKMVHTTVRV